MKQKKPKIVIKIKNPFLKKFVFKLIFFKKYYRLNNSKFKEYSKHLYDGIIYKGVEFDSLFFYKIFVRNVNISITKKMLEFLLAHLSYNFREIKRDYDQKLVLLLDPFKKYKDLYDKYSSDSEDEFLRYEYELKKKVVLMTEEEIEETEKNRKSYFNKFIDLYLQHFGKYYVNLDHNLTMYLDDYFAIRDDYTERKSFKKKITKKSLKKVKLELRRLIKKYSKLKYLLTIFYKKYYLKGKFKNIDLNQDPLYCAELLNCNLNFNDEYSELEFDGVCNNEITTDISFKYKIFLKKFKTKDCIN